MTHRIITALFLLCATSCFAADYPAPKEGDYTAKNFKFHDGESLPELRLHYATIGVPHRDARGQITNAVLILHGTGGSWKQFTQPQFANVLFGPGQPLDATRYYIILPDNVGHGGSSKPSNGLRMRFPQYDYDDMVAAQHLLVSEGLGVQHLRLIFGTSMGCMHSFVWGETYPDFMDALMPMACQTVQIAGRNRMWRKAVIDSIKLDPAWNNGEYKDEPVNGLRSAVYILAIAGSAPLLWQRLYPTRDDANEFVEEAVEPRVKSLDANDMLNQFDSSRNYNPSPNLEKIRAPLMWINTTDDFVNPPELSTPESEVKRIPRGTFHLIQATDQTRGHGTHTWAAFWKQYLVQLLRDSEQK
ncbi:MAG: alpha/beta fold hydrolase [Acidobacteriia bacterium]|nr:alpha/beta fold hydrolase [Terriglobia bacterium]